MSSSLPAMHPASCRLFPGCSGSSHLSSYPDTPRCGTEIGLGVEPEITFSTALMARSVHHPYDYAAMLEEGIKPQPNAGS
jgi:hypothetical protein